MSFLLKIVEGPNKGAEIALVEDVAITLGKGDDCDVVLADATLPDAPLGIVASSTGVTVGGEAIELFHVKTVGATSFAAGPADSPWEELVWPKVEKTEARETADEVDSAQEAEKVAAENPPDPEPEEPPRRKGRGGCLAVLAILLLAAAVLCWHFREQTRPYARKAWDRASCMVRDFRNGENSPAAVPSPVPQATIRSVAAKYGLSVAESPGRTLLAGNMKTRRERLAATAEAYAVQPGVDLDISDDESFRASAEDALFTLTEGALKVAVATNRVLGIVGNAQSAAALKTVLDALNADMPKIRNVDVSGVAVANLAVGHATDGMARGAGPVASRVARLAPKAAAVSRNFPVCGILTTPYPCLVMRDGSRVLEGAVLGGGVIVKIEADSVTLTNSTGRFTWKP